MSLQSLWSVVETVTTRGLLAAVVLTVTACGGSTSERPAQFDMLQIAGWWAESSDTTDACDRSKARMKYTLSADGSRLLVRFDRARKTGDREVDAFEAEVLKSSRRSLTLRYPSETRPGASGEPGSWDMVFVAPGIYRWRETRWSPGRVNEVIGVRCSM